jgi:hypothetical protein
MAASLPQFGVVMRALSYMAMPVRIDSWSFAMPSLLRIRSICPRDGLQCGLVGHCCIRLFWLRLITVFVSERRTNRRSSASNPCPRAVQRSASRRSPP